jgi:hypothetical protein
MPDTHDCPGRCGNQVARHQLACKPCWFRLPKVYRDDVNAAYRGRARDPGRHRRAMQQAFAWYRDNPEVHRHA